MNIQPAEEKKQIQKYHWTKLLWLKIIVINVFGMFTLAWIFNVLGSYSPFRYAVIISVGIFFLSVIIVSNVKRAKPWSRFRWE